VMRWSWSAVLALAEPSSEPEEEEQEPPLQEPTGISPGCDVAAVSAEEANKYG